MKKGKGVYLKSTLELLRLFIKPRLKMKFKGDISKLSLSETIAEFLCENDRRILHCAAKEAFKLVANEHATGRRNRTGLVREVKKGELMLISLDYTLKSVNIEFEDYKVYQLPLTRFRKLESTLDELSRNRFRNFMQARVPESQ